jgi:6-phospho-beta-glucosidase
MEDSDVIEAKCLVNKNGAIPAAAEKPDNPYIIGLMQAVKAYEKLTVRAVINGSRSDALAALMIHPLIGDYQKAKGVLDEMLDTNADYVPKELLKKRI